MVKDINPSGDAYPLKFYVFNDLLLFRATDSDGVELWISDGTPSDTSKLKDIYSGSSGSYPYYFVSLGERVFFTAKDSTHQTELWVTDGTASETNIVKDIKAGASGSDTAYLTNANGTIFFYATDGSSGYELWRTDGTETGTEMVVDLAAGANSSDPMPLYYNNENIEEFTHAGNGIVYFWADAEADGTYELYRSDGTPSGTSQIGTVIWE